MHDWVIKPKMRSVPGVAEINSWGGLEKQYQIRIDPLRLVRHDISFDEVMTAVKDNNLNVGGGNINENGTGDMFLVQGIGRPTTIEELEDIVITAKQGVPICVRDVAQVAIGHQIRVGTVTTGGEGEVVLGLGFMLMGQNSYAVTRRLKDKLEEVKAKLPPTVKVATAYDRTRLVDHVIATVRSNLCEGRNTGDRRCILLSGQFEGRADRGSGHSTVDVIRLLRHARDGNRRYVLRYWRNRFRNCRG